jgi:5-formyltetrahydrofolate cyclo-ligase
MSTVSYRFSDTVLLYSPIKSEVDITSVALAAIRSGKRIAYPRCHDDYTVSFHYVDSINDLTPGKYGILEPDGDLPVFEHDSVTKKENCICLIPALLFDREGYRVGYGKGFYDRFLGKYPKLFSVGICFSNQVDEALIPEPFDIPLHLIVTEKERYEQNEFN